MNFSGISKKTLMGRVMRFPLRFIPGKMRMPILQGRLKGKKWIVEAGTHGCWIGCYEHQTRLLFEKTITEGSVVFDVGANVGFYTILASVLVGPNGRVFSFEPVPRNLFYLKEHLRLNSIKNVTVVEAAVTNHYGTANFDFGRHPSTGHITKEGNCRVQTVGLDKFVEKESIPRPDYIKIDVEGAEMLVLKGADRILNDRHPTLFLSTHGSDIHSRCCRYLQSMGYDLLPIGVKRWEVARDVLARYSKPAINS